MISRFNIDYMWNAVVNPRLGTTYQWGTFDCSMAVSQELEALLYGPAMTYARQFTTMTFIGAQPGDTGPFGGVASTTHLVCIDGPDAMPDAAMIIAVNQGPTPDTSHMICQVGGVDIEMGGESNNYHTSKTDPTCADIHDAQFNQWFALPKDTVTDTLFADVSEFQCPVNDIYPYPVLSIRSNDGSYQDHNFAQNYQWCVNACDSGKLEFFICYYYWRPGETGVNTHMAMVNAQGGPHPRMVSMIDLESGGNPDSDQSATLNDEYNRLVQWLGGNDKRVIGYANIGDERTMWQAKPSDLKWILAGYGSNPTDPSIIKLAHQYTDGQVGAGSLPSGAPPFGSCDMNSADGFDPAAFAAACGLGAPIPPPSPPSGGDPFMALTDQQQADLYNAIMGIAAVVSDNNTQLRGPNQQGWPQLGQNDQGQNLTLVDAIAALKKAAEATSPKASQS